MLLMCVEITLILAGNIKYKSYHQLFVVLPRVVFLPRGLDLIKASNRLEAVRMMRMIETKNIISDQ